MLGILFSLVAFIAALGVLITVHEFGHFIVAKKCGVQVLRFSVGFGKPIWRYQKSENHTEYVVGAIPLGGYVKMLDEREGEVPPEKLDFAFNRKSVVQRIMVVIAGPAANFLFAIVAYWLVFVLGMPGTAPIVGSIVPDTIAERAGFLPGDKVVDVNSEPTPTWQAVTTELVSNAIAGAKVAVSVRTESGEIAQRSMDLVGGERFVDEGVVFMEAIGLSQWPHDLAPIIGRVEPEYPAAIAGLMRGDRIVAVDGDPIELWREWVEKVVSSEHRQLEIDFDRNGEILSTVVRPALIPGDETNTPRVGVMAQFPKSLRIMWSIGPIDAIGRACKQTLTMSVSTVTMLWKMLIGKASIKNISGPLKIAEVAGDSANAGYSAFLQLLALLSVSLGVLNLLPIPVLDGGHLLYYVIELFTRRPVSERVQLAGQQVGILLLVLLMGVAFFNDITGILARIQ